MCWVFWIQTGRWGAFRIEDTFKQNFLYLQHADLEWVGFTSQWYLWTESLLITKYFLESFGHLFCNVLKSYLACHRSILCNQLLRNKPIAVGKNQNSKYTCTAISFVHWRKLFRLLISLCCLFSKFKASQFEHIELLIMVIRSNLSLLLCKSFWMCTMYSINPLEMYANSRKECFLKKKVTSCWVTGTKLEILKSNILCCY